MVAERPEAERFWDKVLFGCGTKQCWEWQATLRNGYGQVWYGGRLQNAHRVAYKELRGDIPDKYQIDHLCRNRSCVKPEHMEAVEAKENNMRGDSAAAVNARKTHCKRGHMFTENNTYHHPGGRQCRACNNARCLSLKEVK